MQITQKSLSPTKIELTLIASDAELLSAKNVTVAKLGKNVNMAGFRKGHAPAALVEKNIDEAALQSEFLDKIINDVYVQAIVQEKIRPATTPEVSVTKFVPFTSLEFKATVEVVGKITLPDYKKLKITKNVEPTAEKDVTAVINDLRTRDSTKKDVTRAAKDGDEVVIDFAGDDATTGEAIAGAAGTDYPLVLGSNTFIPGFEPELVGLKPGAEKTFEITFPKDYGSVELQSKKVAFTVTVKIVREITLAKLDDAFAAKIGPFKTVAELKTDVKKQLEAEKENQAQRAFENELLATISEKATADIPTVLVEEEMDRMEEEEKRNLLYRGQTWQEHLDAEKKTAEIHREDLREQAEVRVKTGLVLGQAADEENIEVSDDELDQRIDQLKQQYTDAKMQAELGNPDNRRELMSRLLTEKTIDRLASYVKA